MKRGIGKRAMAIGQVFIFIIAIITFGLIMIFGYKAIQGFIGKGETVQYIAFQQEVKKSINTISTDFGSVDTQTFRPPSKYQRACFVDFDYLATPDEETALKQASAFAYDMFLDAKDAKKPVGAEDDAGYKAVSENIFLEPRFEDTAPILVDPLKVTNADGSEPKLFECFDIVNSQFQVTLEGKGDATEVSQPLE
jgi:hypothetical protein